MRSCLSWCHPRAAVRRSRGSTAASPKSGNMDPRFRSATGPRMTPKWIVALLLVTPFTYDIATAEDTVTIFAASSLTNVIEEILASGADGIRTGASFAGTATLARQIEAGAPANIFISANELWADWLGERGLLAEGTRRAVAANHLVLVSPASSSLPDLSPWHLLQHSRVHRIAIGETSSVPAGIYGRQVLEQMGLWDTLKPKLLPADSVRNVLAWVEHGEADLAFIYASDALASGKVTIRSIFRPGKSTGLSPVYYTAAIVDAGDSEQTRAVFDTLFSPDAKAIFAAHGFQNTP